MELVNTLLQDPIVTAILLALIPLVFILVYALVVLYGEMKMAAHIQNRLAYMENGWHGSVLIPLTSACLAPSGPNHYKITDQI